MPPPLTNKSYTKPPTKKQILAFIKTFGYDEDPKAKITSVSTFVAIKLRQPWRAILSVLNMILTGNDTRWDAAILPILQILGAFIPQRSDVDLHIKGKDSPLTKLINTIDGKFKFRMEIPDAMISGAIKQSAGYKFNKQKRLKVRRVKLMRIQKNYIDLLSKVEERQVEKDIEDTYPAKAGLKLKGVATEDPTVQSQLDLRRGSKENTYEEKDDEIDDFDMDLSDDELKGDDAAGFGVLMYNKSTESLKSTYLSPIVNCSSLKYIQNLLNKLLVHELMYLMSNLVYTDAHIISVVAILEGHPKVTSYLSGASEVPFGINVDIQATEFVLQEMFSDNADHQTSSPPANTTHSLNSLQAKAKKLMKNAKKNMRKINFKKVIAQKFKEYDQKLEALISINVSEVIEKAIQAKVLTKMKNQLPTYVLNVIAKYVKPRLNNFVHEVMKNNQISLFTTPSPTTTDDLSKMDLNLKLQNKMHQNKSHETYNTHQKLYDTLYESITLDQEALDVQDIEPSFNKRSSKKDKALMVLVQENTPAEQPQDHEEYYVRERPHIGWFTKKLGSVDAAKRRTIWFDLLLKSDIDQNEDHILGPSTVAYKNDVELEYDVDQLKASVLREAQWNNREGDVSKPRSFKRHMSKSTKPYSNFYNTDFYYLVNVSMGEKYATSLTKHFPDRWSKKIYYYQIEALNSIYHWEDGRQEFFKAEINNRSPDKVYSNNRIISVVRVDVKKK
ncbi:hypothetical protein Tco_0039979 [Tanacetum coccineum]